MMVPILPFLLGEYITANIYVAEPLPHTLEVRPVFSYENKRESTETKRIRIPKSGTYKLLISCPSDYEWGDLTLEFYSLGTYFRENIWHIQYAEPNESYWFSLEPIPKFYWTLSPIYGLSTSFAGAIYSPVLSAQSFAENYRNFTTGAKIYLDILISATPLPSIRVGGQSFSVLADVEPIDIYQPRRLKSTVQAAQVGIHYNFVFLAISRQHWFILSPYFLLDTRWFNADTTYSADKIMRRVKYSGESLGTSHGLELSYFPSGNSGGFIFKTGLDHFYPFYNDKDLIKALGFNKPYWSIYAGLGIGLLFW